MEHLIVHGLIVHGVPLRAGRIALASLAAVPGSTAPEADLMALVAERLAGFKVPVQVWFRPEPLPRNANGTILKRDLKAELFG